MRKSLLPAKYVMFLLFLGAFAFVSCKKDKNEDEKEPTKKELLSSKWKVSDVKNSSGLSIIDFPVPQIVCLKDNIFTLRTDDSYTIDEGAIACDPSTAGSGTWSLTSNESRIEFKPSAGDPLTFDLIEVNATTLKIAYALTGTGIPDVDGTYTIILEKT